MTKFVGRLSQIGLAKEATRGTALAPTLWLGRNTISFDDKTETAREVEGLGRIEDSDSNFVVSKYGEGEFEFDLNDKATGIILTSIMGASPVTTGGPTYSHAYTLSNTNQHQSLSVCIDDPDTTKIFPLAVVDSLTISVEPTEIVKGTATFMSRGSKDWTAQTADYTSLGNKFLQQHTQIKLASSIAGLSGASAISVKSFEITIASNTVRDDVLGTVQSEDILNQQFSVEGSITLNKEDETYRNLMLDGTYKAMEFKLNRASDSSLTIQMPRVDFTEWEQDRDLDSIVTQSINFKGNYDATNAQAIITTCTLVNTYSGSAY